MKALILVNAYSATDTRQATRLKAELSARNMTVDVKRNDGFFGRLIGDELRAKTDCDFCIFLDKDKYVSHILERSGIRLFDKAAAIEVCDDKMSTHIALSGHGIQMPDTLPGLLCYDGAETIKAHALDEAEATLGYPVIIKQSFGSMGKGVFKADDRKALEIIAEKVKTTPHIFQRYIGSSHGRDCRVIVIGGKVVGGIQRRSAGGDFRSNVGLGGSAVQTDVPDAMREAAEKAAKILDLDYCGIDFLYGETPLLCEVNSNAYFDAFEQATGINVAGLYAEHIVKTMRGE